MTAKILKIAQNGWNILRNRSCQKPKQNLLLLMEYAEAAQEEKTD